MNKKIVKKWFCVVLSLFCILTTVSPVYAAENAKITDENVVEMTENVMPRATVGSVVFNVINSGTDDQSKLEDNGSQTIRFTATPKTLSYIARPVNNGNESVVIRFSANTFFVILDADGRTHTVDISECGLPANTNMTIYYSGATFDLLSISLVFGN